MEKENIKKKSPEEYNVAGKNLELQFYRHREV